MESSGTFDPKTPTNLKRAYVDARAPGFEMHSPSAMWALANSSVCMRTSVIPTQDLHDDFTLPFSLGYIESIEADTDSTKYVYDLTTNSGTFAAGVETLW